MTYEIPASETKRIQDHAFAMARLADERGLAARRTLRALDGYWASEPESPRTSPFYEAWWCAYERWRKRFEETFS